MHQNEKNNAVENTIDEMEKITTPETIVSRGFGRMSELNEKKQEEKLLSAILKKAVKNRIKKSRKM